MRIIFCFFLLMIFAESKSQTFKAKLQDLSFMCGTWYQNHEWGDMEEFWGKPMGDCMICSYRCVKNGKVLFYEFIVIEQSDSVPVMKLRHFKPGNIGWEEKDNPYAYPLIAVGKNKATFAAADKSLFMTYERIDSLNMNILLKEKNKKAEWESTTFYYSLKAIGN